ncbi:unnamed protein product [Moneuplotes crassus]|uniref:Uncharacterized protein n=1 Tax=Euplotes crassus TaxID=5936 RepID=A0AAD2D4K1_EUPCR|nr:unnamed protein product [Moneuplotes crassus]
MNPSSITSKYAAASLQGPRQAKTKLQSSSSAQTTLGPPNPLKTSHTPSPIPHQSSAAFTINNPNPLTFQPPSPHPCTPSKLPSTPPKGRRQSIPNATPSEALEESPAKKKRESFAGNLDNEQLKMVHPTFLGISTNDKSGRKEVFVSDSSRNLDQDMVISQLFFKHKRIERVEYKEIVKMFQNLGILPRIIKNEDLKSIFDTLVEPRKKKLALGLKRFTKLFRKVAERCMKQKGSKAVQNFVDLISDKFKDKYFGMRNTNWCVMNLKHSKKLREKLKTCETSKLHHKSTRELRKYLNAQSPMKDEKSKLSKSGFVSNISTSRKSLEPHVPNYPLGEPLRQLKSSRNSKIDILAFSPNIVVPPKLTGKEKSRSHHSSTLNSHTRKGLHPKPVTIRTLEFNIYDDKAEKTFNNQKKISRGKVTKRMIQKYMKEKDVPIANLQEEEEKHQLDSNPAQILVKKYEFSRMQSLKTPNNQDLMTPKKAIGESSNTCRRTRQDRNATNSKLKQYEQDTKIAEPDQKLPYQPAQNMPEKRRYQSCTPKIAQDQKLLYQSCFLKIRNAFERFKQTTERTNSNPQHTSTPTAPPLPKAPIPPSGPTPSSTSSIRKHAYLLGLVQIAVKPKIKSQLKLGFQALKGHFQ